MATSTKTTTDPAPLGNKINPEALPESALALAWCVKGDTIRIDRADRNEDTYVEITSVHRSHSNAIFKGCDQHGRWFTVGVDWATMDQQDPTLYLRHNMDWDNYTGILEVEIVDALPVDTDGSQKA